MMGLLPPPPSRRVGRAGSADVGDSGESGFTLIELLVALMIFAMLSAAGVLLLGNSVSAQAQIKVRLDDLAAVQRAGGALAADLGRRASAAPKSERLRLLSGRIERAKPCRCFSSCAGAGTIWAICRNLPCERLNIGCGRSGWNGGPMPRLMARRAMSLRPCWTMSMMSPCVFGMRKGVGGMNGRRPNRT
jgi:prepilin-type N-terminal cleavage/methylation domain-containing protein